MQKKREVQHQLQHRQGDVLFIPCDCPPGVDEARLDYTNDQVVVEGEVTGHAHRLVSKERAIAFITVGEKQFAHMKPKVPTALAHEDHAHHSMESGWFEIRRQRVMDAGKVRTVLD